MSGRAPRALMVFDYFARYTAGLMEGLREQGWDPGILNREHDNAFGGEPGAMDAFLERRLGRGFVNARVEGRVRDPKALRSVWEARKVVRAFDADVVHLQACTLNDIRLLPIAGLRRGRFAATIHDVEVHPGDPELPRSRWFIGDRLFNAAGVIFVHTEALRDQLRDERGISTPMVVIPHGIDAADETPLPEAPELLFFGRLATYKGLDVLLDALPRLWEQRPETTLTIAGEGDLPVSRILEDPRVRLLHRHIDEAEVPDLFTGAQLVVLPYIEASQSGVGSLAKGFGRPMLATATGGLPDLVADGSGVLVEPGNAVALADGLERALADRGGLERMAAAGRATLLGSAGWPAVGRMTVEAYEHYLLSTPRRRRRPRRS